MLYWFVSILGFLDLDFLDVDLDLEGTEGIGPLGALAVFIKLGEIPFALTMSLIVLNFWIISMLMYYLPIEAGGLISGILLLPALIISVFITKLELVPFRKIFLERKNLDDIEHKLLGKRAKMLCDLDEGILGQAEVRQEGASIVVNVKILFEGHSFKKNETVLVFKKDEEKDLYYVAEPLLSDDEYKEMEEF